MKDVDGVVGPIWSSMNRKFFRQIRAPMGAAITSLGMLMGAVPASVLAQPAIPQDMRVNWEAIDARANALSANGDPKDLLAAGYWLTFSGSGNPGHGHDPEKNRQASRWIKRAAIDGSEDVRLAKIALLFCLGEDEPGCNVERAIHTVQTLAADDMLVQLLLWRHAASSEDQGDAEQAFSRFLAATRYVDDSRQDVALLVRSMQGVSAVSPISALSTGMLAETDIDADLAPLANVAVARTLVTAIPYTYLWPMLDDECPKSGKVEARMFEKCREMLLAMTEAQSIVEVMFSHSRVLTYARDDAERRALELKRRQVSWVLEQLAGRAPTNASQQLPVKASEYWSWVMDVGEWEAVRRLLQRCGLPEQPPKGWMPSRDYDV